LSVNGNSPYTKNVAPYTYPSGAETGSNWNGGIGAYDVHTSAFNQDNGGGTHCDELDIHFSLTANDCSITNNSTISGPGTVCSGESFTINSVQDPVSGGTIEYAWLISYNGTTWNEDDIVFTTDLSSQDFTLTESAYIRRCAIPAGCGWTWSQSSESNLEYVEVIEVDEVTIVAPKQEICVGEEVTLTANGVDVDCPSCDSTGQYTNSQDSIVWDLNGCYSVPTTQTILQS
jgi:hypothetical protein